MALDGLETTLEECELQGPYEAHSTASTESPYAERLLQPNEIRLLTIDREADRLRLSVTRHEFKDDLVYDAISYVWGAPMLQYLPPNRSYWLDSICINQQDSKEKAVQIPLMHRIYSLAACVVVWMGVPTTQSAKFMAEFSSALEKERRWNSIISQGLRPWVQARKLLVADEHFLEGMVEVYNHEWFERLWTFQEAVLAKRSIMLLGALWIGFEEFLEFTCDGYFKIDGYISYSLRGIGTINVPRGLMQNFPTLRNYRAKLMSTGPVSSRHIALLFHQLRGRQVKEPVDRVWAITGLLSEHLRSKLNPQFDYTDKARADFWRTHIQCTKTITSTEETLNLLAIPPTGERRPHFIPSWCPALAGIPECLMLITGDWTTGVSGRVDKVLLQEAIEEGNQASSPNLSEQLSSLYASRKFIAFEEDDDCLQTCGCVVDTILEVVEDSELRGARDYIENADGLSFVKSNPVHARNVNLYIQSLLLVRRTVYSTNNDVDSIPAEYMMALLCDTRLSSDAITAYEDAWPAFIDREPHSIEALPVERRLRADRCYDRLVGLTGHLFFSTTGGRFGIATPGCKPGDKVSVLYGGLPLHILRWPETESETSTIHGKRPAEFCGVAFIPHLMEPHEQEAARLGPDEIFVIG